MYLYQLKTARIKAQKAAPGKPAPDAYAKWLIDGKESRGIRWPMSSLYLDHFGLCRPPFAITPDPDLFFAGGERNMLGASLLHAALQGEGIVMVTGEVGSGKTLMSRLLLSQLPEHVDTVYLPNPTFSRDEIIDVIARDLGLSGQDTRLASLQNELIRRHQSGRIVVAVIDEAHTMAAESLEEVRRLSNLETCDRKLLQLILFGQPELELLLASSAMRQVRDRIVYRFALDKFSDSDAARYLDHRLNMAGWQGAALFTPMAKYRLIRDAKGRARRLNLIADKALLAAFGEGKKRVGTRHVHLAIRDIGANFSSEHSKTERIRRWIISVLIALSLFWLSQFPHPIA